MKIADLYDNFLFDLDGCIYLGDQVIPAAPPTVAGLRRMGKGVLFLTNAPYLSRENFAAKLRRMGIEAGEQDIVSSSWAVAQYIARHHDIAGKTAFAVGSEEFKQDMRDAGLRVVEDEEAKRADFVVVGGYFGFNYKDIMLANFAIRNGARFYTSNRDATFPTPEGLWPGTGVAVAAIECASGQTAISTGKPEPPMIEVARAFLGDGRTVIVGDRLDSDIEGGNRAGIASALVLTGVTTREMLAGSPWTPDHVLEDVGGLLAET
jgi:phosphoglycolate/pyridoxal phosphate phosphatase family enzyme